MFQNGNRQLYCTSFLNLRRWHKAYFKKQEKSQPNLPSNVIRKRRKKCQGQRKGGNNKDHGGNKRETKRITEKMKTIEKSNKN